MFVLRSLIMLIPCLLYCLVLVGVASHKCARQSRVLNNTQDLNKYVFSSCLPLLFLLVVMSGAKPKLGPQRPEETQSVEPAPLFRESGYHKSPLAVSLTLASNPGSLPRRVCVCVY